MDREDNANEIEERYKLITENMEDVIWTIDMTTGLFTYLSPSVFKLRGYTPEEYENRTMKDVLTKKSYNAVQEILSQIITAYEAGDETAKTRTVEVEIMHKAGHIVNAEVAATLIKNRQGRVDKIIGITRNINERKKTEETLRTSEQRNRTLLNAIPDLMFRVSQSGIFLDYKAGSDDKLYIPPEFFLGKKIVEVLPEDVAAKCMAKMDEAFETKTLQAFEYEMTVADVLNTFEARVEANIAGDEAIFIIRDITVQKRNEIKFENERQTLRSLLETIPDIVWLKNPKGEYLFCNSIFELYSGKKEADIIGKTDNYFSAPDRVLKVQKADRSVLEENKQMITLEELSFAGNGYKGLFETIRKPMFDSEGKLIGVLGISRDITKLHNANSALRESERNLKEAQHTAKVGSWIYNLQTDQLSWSDEVFSILGIEKENFTVTYEAFLNAIHPEDRKAVNEAYTTSLNLRVPYNINHRVMLKDGSIKYINERCVTEYSNLGAAVKSIGTIQDITEVKKTEDELKEREELYKNLVNTLQEGISIIKLDGIISWVNKRVLGFYGVESADEILGRNFADFIVEPDKELINKLFAECLQAGRLDAVEITIINQLKGNRIVELSAFLIKDEQKNPLYVVSVMRDMTEQRKTEKMIKRLSIAVEQTEDTVFITDINGVIEYVNNSLEFTYGYGRSELIGQKPNIFKSGIKDKDFYKNLWDTILKGEPFRSEFINRRKDGAYVFEDRNITPIKDDKGEITNFLSVGRDISERKYAEIKQAKNERRYANILQTAIDGLLVIDEKGKILDVNQAYITMSGYQREELLRMDLSDLVVNYTEEIRETRFKTVFKNGKGQFESKHRRKDGSIYTVEVSVMVSDFEGINLIAFVKDISERIKLFDDLAEAKQKAEEMNKLKSNFLANMSHELRTPLTGIIGYSEILFKTIEDTGLKEMADIIFSSGHRLLRTLNMILDLTKIESKKEDLFIEEFDAIESVRHCFKLFEKSIVDKKLEAVINLPDEPVVIQSDKRMFDAILNNLVNNAVKFTKKGSISISVFEERRGSTGKMLCIEVKDTGIGMNEEAIKVIFEEFRQASEGLSRLHEGAGLGLTLTRKYVGLLQGEIKVESKPGEGSTFTVEIPVNVPDITYKVPETEMTQSAAVQNLKPVIQQQCVLLVDDDKIMFGIMNNYIKKIADFDFASSYDEAIKKIVSAKYDLIILDVNLKEEKNGIDLMKEIRQLDDYINVPIIACTAYAMTGDKEKLLEEGFTDYLSKPFSPKKLVDKVAELLKSAGN